MENHINSFNPQTGVKFAVSRVEKAMETFKENYPDPASVNCIYGENTNTDWTNGFWSGMLWLSYEFTKCEKYKDAALSQIEGYYQRIYQRIRVNHHDMGFLYLPSCVAAYKLTKNEEARTAALMAADNLCQRYQEKGQFIQAWGELGEPENYRLIIDCLMNVPILFWAEKESGNKKYGDIARAHLDTTARVIMRGDAGTYHTFYFDHETGEPLYGATYQGYASDSIWARGQAWGVYGFALAYRHTGKELYKERFLRITEKFIHNLPEDNIPAWDMIFTDTKTQKDTSAAVIAVCGILEMARLCCIPDNFVNKAIDMMDALQSTCFTDDVPNSNGILKHSVYSMPHNRGVDECSIWGDYYYMEALMRISNPNWESYWG